MGERGWSQTDLAVRLGGQPGFKHQLSAQKWVSKLLAGKAKVLWAEPFRSACAVLGLEPEQFQSGEVAAGPGWSSMMVEQPDGTREPFRWGDVLSKPVGARVTCVQADGAKVILEVVELGAGARRRKALAPARQGKEG